MKTPTARIYRQLMNIEEKLKRDRLQKHHYFLPASSFQLSLFSMQRNSFIIPAFVLFIIGCHRPSPQKTLKSPFIHDAIIKITPVKDQGNSPLCWAYAMLATIESERLMMGDSIHLSADYIARTTLSDQLHEAYFAQGKQPIALRGIPSMALRAIERHGLLQYDSYHASQTNYNVVIRKATQVLKGATSLRQVDRRVNDMLDRELGSLPRKVFLLGAEYTPKEFAHSLYQPHEYLALTSFTHHPYGQQFVLEIPDNRLKDRFFNLQLDTLMHRAKRALRRGHPVCWEGDITEPGYAFDSGVAKIPNEHTIVTPALRQQQFEMRKTTDDHCMELIGLAHDQQGTTYFIAKNSWGTRNPYGGLMYLSESYVRLKTIALYMIREAYL